MEFRIADTFTSSLAKLNGDEQKSVKQTAFDLQLNPVNPGMSFHKLDRSKDKNFWSVRVSSDIRLIVHKTQASLLLCYVDHHDAAYDWAARRKLEQHPKTGAAQLVEIRETVREIEIPSYVEAKPTEPADSPTAPLLFVDRDEDDLLALGVPSEWLIDVKAATEDSLLELVDHLPGEAAEALLELATGGTPTIPVQASVEADPFAHPDAQRRFRVMTDADELQRALEFPWDQWTIFLHPAQRDLVERHFNGPARVSGSAGTGKTVVALHRAVHLARTHPNARVLLTTFSIALARMLQSKVRRLVGDDADLLNRLRVRAINEAVIEMYEESFGKPKIPTAKMLRSLQQSAAKSVDGHKFSLQFIEAEWNEVVDAWQVDSWEAYRVVQRLGRKTRLSEPNRALLWSICERVRADLNEQGLATIPMVFRAVASHINESENHAAPADFVIVDEAQDISVCQLRLLAAIAGERENGLFFAGDLGQRIFQTPFSWKSLGVSVQGRASTLRINYRTSHQIRRKVDRLLPPELADVDGLAESRFETVSVFNGAEPDLFTAKNIEAEVEHVSSWIKDRLRQGVQPHEIGIIVRSESEMGRARAMAKASGLDAHTIDGAGLSPVGKISLSTMHLAKGLEFRAVVVAACDDDVIPQQHRIESVGDQADLADIYETERHLLYVACTRARDDLLMTGVDPASEFLDDLKPHSEAETP